MSQPNIVFIFTDQMRADAVAAAGNPIIKTPNLDRIAAEGAMFSSAYSPSPVCVPARCSMIHGQYTDKTGCFENNYAMPDDRPSFMAALTDAGYRTHGIGKMHFMPDPHALRGFQSRQRQEEILRTVADDEYLTYLHGEGFDYIHDAHGVRGPMYYIPQTAQMPARCHPTQWIGDRSVEFIEGADDSQPFLLWTSFIHPHPPFAPPTPWHKLYEPALMPLPKRPTDAEALQIYINRFQNRYKYRDQGLDDNLLRVMKAHYYACVSFIDFQVGRLLDALERTDRLDNTLIVFTSDHGEFLGDYNCFGKRAMHDAASRVPLLARLGERFAPGAMCDTPTNLVDVMPTLLAAAGVDVNGLDLDGADLAAIAAGEQSDRTVYSQHDAGPTGVHMAVNSCWKYFYSAADRREFLFDRDGDETRNRAEVPICRDAVAAMRANLMDFYRSRGHTADLDGDGWKLYEQPQIPRDPDALLLRQDAPWAEPMRKIPGYNDGE